MKGRNPNKKPTTMLKKRNSTNPHLSSNPKKRKNNRPSKFFPDSDPEIASEPSDDDDFFADDGEKKRGEDEEEEENEEERETAEERRKRLAMELVDKVRRGEMLEREEEELGEEEDREERDGNRDSLVMKLLQQEQMEDSGRLRRLIASKVQKPENEEETRLLLKHRQSVTAVALSDDDLRGYSASKDGCIVHWDVETGKAEKYLWPADEVLKSHGLRGTQGRAQKHSKQVLALAVSSDGRYLATGGLDRHVHLWDTRAREHIQAFPGHKGPVSCLAFRLGTSELFSGSFDRQLKIWNADDRAYISTLFGHQSDVLSIDCMRKERVLTVGRDRSMLFWKVPEESRLVFNASAQHLECCCFVGNDEFLSGSDDGSLQLWGVQRKKPVCIIKNAHSLPFVDKQEEPVDNGRMLNGQSEVHEQKASNPCSTARSWVESVAVCRNSDFAASGAGNGCIKLWAIQSENRGMKPLFDIPLIGYVNSLAIAKSGRFLVAGVGQEPRLGRWDRISTARNGVALQSFKLGS